MTIHALLLFLQLYRPSIIIAPLTIVVWIQTPFEILHLQTLENYL